MLYKIKKGKHRAWPLALGLFFKPTTIRKTVIFGAGCNYWLEGVDMLDTNKLFGLAFIPEGVHKESARFGWRYDNAKSVVLSAYCYVKGERVIKELCKVPRFQKITCALYVQPENYHFVVMIDGTPQASQSVPKFHNRKLAYKLGVYFGGNQLAPQTMEIELLK
jgi:hypothetical protein